MNLFGLALPVEFNNPLPAFLGGTLCLFKLLFELVVVQSPSIGAKLLEEFKIDKSGGQRMSPCQRR